jgi:hypothetical protein
MIGPTYSPPINLYEPRGRIGFLLEAYSYSEPGTASTIAAAEIRDKQSFLAKEIQTQEPLVVLYKPSAGTDSEDKFI